MQLPTLTPPTPPMDRMEESSEQDSSKVCTYFQRTSCCSFGNDCKYKHDPSSLLPLAGYTENGYPIRPGCEACTFYTATGWCNHWFSCSKDHDLNRLTGECKESLPPPTIMEQFHRFKYHSFTKEYKPLSTNHLPPAIRDKRWIVGNEYGQSAIPRSAQNRILQSFKNGIPEDVKDRLYRFLPQDARNMQLIRTSTGGYMTTIPAGAMLSRAMSAPHQQYIPHPSITSKVMTPHPLSPTTTITQPRIGALQTPTPATATTAPQYAAAAAGYSMPRLHSYSLDQNKSPYATTSTQQQQRYYTMVQPSSNLSTYSPVYPTAYTMDAAAAVSTSTSNSPTIPCSTAACPTSCGPMGAYYYPSPQPGLSSPSQQQQQGVGSCSSSMLQNYSSMYQSSGQYQSYMYPAQGMSQAYSMPLHMTYPTHGWSYANVESSGDSSAQTGQILEDQDVVESAFKGKSFAGYKLTDDRSNIMEEDAEDGLFYDQAR